MPSQPDDDDIVIDPEFGRGTRFTVRMRRFILAHVVDARSIAHALPTTVTAVYYVGVNADAWPDEASYVVEQAAKYVARGEEAPRHIRTTRQKTSDALGWLIDHGLVDEDEIIDETATWFGAIGTDDVLADTLDYARRVRLNPWSPNPIPVILCEGRNDLAILTPLAVDNLCRAFPTGGMGGNGTLRWISDRLTRTTRPIGYVGDNNKPGEDIEANTRNFLTGRGWEGTWTRIAVTDAQAVGLPHKMKIDRRTKIAVPTPSVESAAFGTAAMRTAVLAWLDEQRPTEPNANEDERDEIIMELVAIRRRRRRRRTR